MILGLYCAGGSGKNHYDLAKEVNRINAKWEKIIFIDDIIDANEFYNSKVMRFEDACDCYTPSDIEFIITIGDPSQREKLYEKVEQNGYSFTQLISPYANIAETVILEDGVTIARATITADTIIKKNTTISEYVVIGHDSIIGENNFISPNSFIAGHCTTNDNVYIGAGAITKDRVNIGKNSVLALGAVVFKDVPEDIIVIGNPGKYIKRNEGKGLF